MVESPQSLASGTHNISLCMIVKDETETLLKCLESVRGYVNEIVVAWNGTNAETKTIMEKFGCKIVPYEWCDDFAHARNFSFDQASYEICFWLDADDILLKGERLRGLTAAFNDPRIGSVWLPYDYDQDEYGNCVMLLYRERLTRKTWWRWKGRIHEVQQPVRDCAHVREESVLIRHQVIPERVQASAARNLRIAQNAYKEEHEEGEADPRTIYDYARALKAGGQREAALEVFKEFVEKSGFDDDRYEALHSIADIYRKFRWYDSAIDAEFQALRLRPKRPEAYFGLAVTYFVLEDWDNVIWFTDLGFRCPPREDNMPIDPIEIQGRPLLPFSMALFQLGKFREAKQVIERALKFFPKNPFLHDSLKQCNLAIKQEELEKATLFIFDHLNRNGEADKLEPLSRALPDFVRDHPVFVRLVNRFKTPEPWQNKIVIYCGGSFELWDPLCVGGGIGGSEEAVISLAPLLAKLGWQVEVYNNCLEEGNYDGALWKPYWTYDKSQPCAVFIAWRDSRSILLAPDGSYCVAWLHDRQKPEYWAEEVLHRIDKFFFLSDFHRTDLPEIPQDKILITANGVKLSQFAVKEVRDPKRCIYASSPDRGLDILLQNWGAIREKVPEAELHVFYGFTKTFDQLHKNNQAMKDFKDTCLKMMKQPGIVYRGRVGHEELAKELMRSAIWTYPTYFGEISCITAMKAQLAGAIPVTMTLAALNETVKYGYKISFTIYDARTQLSFVNMVTELLNNPEKQEKMREPMMKWAREKFGWGKVAEQWNQHFKAALAERLSSATKISK